MSKERGPDYLHGLTEMGTPYEAVAEGKAMRCEESDQRDEKGRPMTYWGGKAPAAPSDRQETPRTDAQAWPTGDTNASVVHADFARQLERELAAASNRAWHLEAELNGARAVSATPASTIRQCMEWINEGNDENGDPVGAQPEPGWETGFAAGVRLCYRILKGRLADLDRTTKP